MSEEQKKKIIKKIIKLKAPAATEKKAGEVKSSKKAAAVKAAPEETAKKASPAVEAAPAPQHRDLRPKEAPRPAGPAGAPPRKFEYQRHNRDSREGGGFGPPRQGQQFQRDRGPRPIGGGGPYRDRPPFKQGSTTTPVFEKDQAGKGKHRNAFFGRPKSAAEIKEKTKNREEAVILSKMEDSIRKRSRKGEAAIPDSIEIGEAVKISDLAKKMNLKASEIIQRLLDLGVQATINDNIDSDTASIVASEFNCKVVVKSLKEEVEIKEEEDKAKDLKPRSPVVTIMGHVDHGKTKLLDAIRNSTIAEHETGGITQHIGAYRVKTPKGDITFIDTPGHEAFTAMRARGANVTDIVILVVSAVDGVMPQTIEALNHAKAAGVPVMVAVNKIDLPEASVDRVKQQLSDHGLLWEEWGGETIYVNVSALKKIGIQDLLDALLLQAEMMELKANPDKRGAGFIIESKMDIGRGAVATVIVKNGSVRIGDNFVVGTTMGKVRGMFDEMGKKMDIALPSYPVEIMGFDEVPTAGDKFYVVESEEVAKSMSSKRLDLKRIEETASIKRVQVQDTMEAITAKEIKELKVIVKGDVQGSVEAINNMLNKMENPDVKVTIIHSGVGTVLESDVMLATATANTAETGVIILAFRVRVDSIAKDKAESEGINIKRFAIIYELLDYIEGVMKGMHKAEIIQKIIGTAEIREIFKIKDVGKIAGSIVKEGFIRKSEKVRLFREGAQFWEGRIKDLRRFKDEVSEVQEGFEFGASFVNYENFKKGDIIECFTEEIKE